MFESPRVTDSWKQYQKERKDLIYNTNESGTIRPENLNATNIDTGFNEFVLRIDASDAAKSLLDVPKLREEAKRMERARSGHARRGEQYGDRGHPDVAPPRGPWN